MARLFTINISFQQQLYTALISMRQQGEDYSCQVRYVDKDLRYLLAGDELVFNLSEGFKEPKAIPKKLAEELTRNTNKAITNFLEHSSF